MRARRGMVMNLPPTPDTSRDYCRICGRGGQLRVSDGSLRRHLSVSDRRRDVGSDGFEAGGTEAVDVSFPQHRELGLAEFHVAAPAAEQASAIERKAALRTTFLFGKNH